jgi:cation transport ATPase
MASQTLNPSARPATRLRTLPGRGVSGGIACTRLRLGKTRLMRDGGVDMRRWSPAGVRT